MNTRLREVLADKCRKFGLGRKALDELAEIGSQDDAGGSDAKGQQGDVGSPLRTRGGWRQRGRGQNPYKNKKSLNHCNSVV